MSLLWPSELPKFLANSQMLWINGCLRAPVWNWHQHCPTKPLSPTQIAELMDVFLTHCNISPIIIFSNQSSSKNISVFHIWITKFREDYLQIWSKLQNLPFKKATSLKWKPFPTGAVIDIHGMNLQQYDNHSKVYITYSELEIKCLQHPFHRFQVIIPGAFVEKNRVNNNLRKETRCMLLCVYNCDNSHSFQGIKNKLSRYFLLLLSLNNFYIFSVDNRFT